MHVQNTRIKAHQHACSTRAGKNETKEATAVIYPLVPVIGGASAVAVGTGSFASRGEGKYALLAAAARGAYGAEAGRKGQWWGTGRQENA